VLPHLPGSKRQRFRAVRGKTDGDEPVTCHRYSSWHASQDTLKSRSDNYPWFSGLI
jgi:hypothetical protein